MNANVSPELNWGKELKFEASPTAPSKKQMSEQDIGIQHAAINSLNAESGQKDSTERELKSPEIVVHQLVVGNILHIVHCRTTRVIKTRRPHPKS